MLSPKIKQARRARSKSMVLGELSRVSRPCSPLDQERALKSGWLKRQRSIMKNWQLRWFVLRPEALYFYKDQEESKAQGCIPLQGSQVNELPANQEEPGRHLFEIVPGGGGEKDRTGMSHETFLLMANSQSDMEDWVRTIRRAIWAPLGGGIFGQHLEETMVCEGGQCGAPQRPVPVLVEQCVCFIREQGLQEEGLFRAPGQTNHVRELQDAFDRGEKPVFDSTTDVHTVASLLKLYIRELPEPVIPFSKYTQFLSCAQLLLKDKEMGIVELGKQVEALPQVNYNLLKYICKFLDEVQSHSNQNKMSVQNLATVFGPNILRPRVEDPVTMMEGSSHVQHLMTVLISEHARLYHRAEPEPEVKNQTQSPADRGKAEWVAQDDTDPDAARSGPAVCPEPQKETPQQSSDPSPGTNHSEPTAARVPEKEDETQTEGKTKAKADGKNEAKAGSGGGVGVALSPSKQSKALPSWRCSLKGAPGGGAAKGRMGGSAGDVSATSGGGGGSGGNWLMNGLSSLRAHRRTASSGERLKDSTLSLKETGVHHALSLRDSQRDSPPLSHRALLQSHRLSAYDNVVGAPSSLSLPADTSGIWSTFEISLADPAEEENGGDQGSGSGQGPDRERPGEPVDVARDGTDGARGRSSAAGCASASATGTENDAPHDNKGQGSSGTNDHVSDLVLELKTEMKRQRIGYETCIRKLEESCAKYQTQVGRLEEELDQERKRFHMLEIRLRNSERAHQDAESRNVHLQKEMEEFFTTLGDLTTTTPRTTTNN